MKGRECPLLAAVLGVAGLRPGVLGRARECMCILPFDLNPQKEEGWAAQALRVGVSRAGALRSDANAGHTWTASLPPLSIALSLALTTNDFLLAVSIMIGVHPKETRSWKGPAATFRWLPWAINLLEPGGSSPSSSGQRACRQQCMALQSRPRWLRNQDPLPSQAQRDSWPRKTPLPWPAPRPGVGAGQATGSGGSPRNPAGTAQPKQPTTPAAAGSGAQV